MHNTQALVKQSRVAEYLAKKGYKILNFSLFNLQNSPPLYTMWDEISTVGALQEFFASTLWSITFSKLKYLQEKTGYIAERFPNRAIIDTLSTLNIAPSASPFFVYAHVMMPHFPFCFNENGGRVRIDNNRPRKELYLGQLRYTNTLALQMINRILEREKGREPIIILQGDHGFRYLENVTQAEIRDEAHSILNAYRVPPDMKIGLHDSIKPIEGFKILF